MKLAAVHHAHAHHRHAHARVLPMPGAPTAAVPATREVRVEVLAKQLSVRERFATLAERFIPGNAAGIDASWQFLISGNGGGEWYVTIRNQKITVITGRGPKPGVTISANAEDYLKIANDEVSGIRAYLTGMVHFEGDRGLAQKFKSLFREPKQ